MTTTIRSVITAGVCLALAAPAAAQEPEWVHELERRIEQQAREFVRAFGLDEGQRGLRGRADDPRRGPEVTEPFSRTVRLARNGTFELSNVAGNIIVTGGGGNDVRIDAVKRTRHRDESQGRARLQEIRIEIREQGNRIEVRTEYPEQRNLFVAVDYTVSLPQDTNVTLKSVSGDVRVTNVRGELRAESVSGDITATGARRLGAIKSVSGDIQITDAESDNLVTVTTVSGDLLVRNLKGRGIDMGSVSGGLQLDGVECDRADLRTVSGDIQYGGSLARNGRYEINTHSGDVRLAVASSGFDVEASTFSGDVRSDYALTLGGNRLDSGGRGRRRGPGPGRAIRGSFGDGGAILSLRSFSGDIVITKR